MQSDYKPGLALPCFLISFLLALTQSTLSLHCEPLSQRRVVSCLTCSFDANELVTQDVCDFSTMGLSKK